MDKKIQCHMIGNAHLDPVWLWSWREGFQENTATFLSALDRSDEFDEFVFTATSAQFFMWIEENEPELFERIRKKVEQGRWVICGGWWVEPDCNVPSGESFARHALYAQNYFYEKFGVTAHTGYCVDSFGHNDMIPQMLRLAGMENYVFMRPGPHENGDLPCLFLWEAPDGSQVTAYRLALQYGFCINMEENLNKCLDMVTVQDKMMFFYGVGNHGGAPTVQNIRDICEIREKRPELDIRFSSPDQFFGEIEKEGLPVVKGSLLHHAAGCYSVNSEIKRLNRKAENALISAEKLMSMASVWRGIQADTMDRAWKNLLFNQFHDTLAGTALAECYQDARNQIGESLSVADRCRNRALQAISFHIDVPYDPTTRPVVVFNPHSWAVRTPVELEFERSSPLFPYERIAIRDADGKLCPCQMIQSACITENRSRFTFMAEIPPLGYSTYFVCGVEEQAQENVKQELVLENSLLRVSFSEESAGIVSIFDKRTRKELLSQPTCAAVYEDLADTWGHTVKKIEKKIGAFAPVSVVVADDGPVRKAIRIVSQYGKSAMVQTYCLYEGDDKITVHTKINWQEHRTALKLCIPVNAETPQATSEIPFGYDRKEFSGREEPMQRWADISGTKGGISLLNDEKYGISFEDGQMKMTVLRCQAYAHHDPEPLDELREYDFIDQGIQKFTYQLKIHNGDWKAAGTIQDATLLNQPVIANYETFHKGELPRRNSAIHIDRENIILSTLKKPYQGDGWILRLYEAYGLETPAQIALFGERFSVSFRPHEIKTLRLRRGTVNTVDFQEWDVEK